MRLGPMGRAPLRRQRWSYGVLRLLFWVVALASLLLVASFQMSVARFLSAGADPAAARIVLQSALAM